MCWPEAWQEITSSEQKAWEAELKRELTAGHLLFGAEVKALARHHECDDVLFSIVGTQSVAVVHLSYGKETNPNWPHTQVFDSLSAWAKQD